LVAELDNDTGGINWYCIVHNIRWRTNAFEGHPVRCPNSGDTRPINPDIFEKTYEAVEEAKDDSR